MPPVPSFFEERETDAIGVRFFDLLQGCDTLSGFRVQQVSLPPIKIRLLVRHDLLAKHFLRDLLLLTIALPLRAIDFSRCLEHDNKTITRKQETLVDDQWFDISCSRLYISFIEEGARVLCTIC